MSRKAVEGAAVWPQEEREWEVLRRRLAVKSSARRVPPPADLDTESSTRADVQEQSMQGSHRQGPLLKLVAVEGDARSVEDLEREALAAVLRAAEEGLTSLSGSGSPKLRFLASVQASASVLLGASELSQALHG